MIQWTDLTIHQTLMKKSNNQRNLTIADIQHNLKRNRRKGT